MNPRLSRHPRRYGRRLTLSATVAVGLWAGVLAFAPAPPLRPYELPEPSAPRWDTRAPVHLLVVEPVAGADEVPTEPEGPLADLEAESWFPVAAVTPPSATSAQIPPPSPRFDFQPITSQMLATQALFRMHPVFDELPRDLSLDHVVVVKVRVTDEGHVVEAKVTKGIDHTLDQQALQAAWQYRLAQSDEGERSDWITLPYEFLDRP